MSVNLGKIISACAPQAYYVGGSLRDGLLKRFSGDIDLTLPRADVKETSLKLAKILKADAFEMDPNFCVWRVLRKDGLQIDLCALAGKNIKEDLKRRDFTVNAFALETCRKPKIEIKKINGRLAVKIKGFSHKDIIDVAGGLLDLKARLVKMTSKKVFEDDPLRLLRAFRTTRELNFTVDKATLREIKKQSAQITKPAGERVQEEFKRIFTCPASAQTLKVMEEQKLLSALMPQIEEQKTCAVCYYGELGVWAHTLLVLERMEYLLNNLQKVFPKYYKKLLPFARDKALYKMAALLHDIAKPATAKILRGRLRFFYHEERGAQMAKEILQRFKYSSAEQKIICKMIEFHLRPSNLASNEIITDKGVYKFFKELGEAALPMLLLCWADYASYVTPRQLKSLLKKSAKPIITIEEGKKDGNLGKTLRHMQLINFLLGKYFKQSATVIKPVRLINGLDVMKALKIKPSPLVGKLLEEVTLAQVEGKVKTKADALKYISARKSACVNK